MEVQMGEIYGYIKEELNLSVEFPLDLNIIDSGILDSVKIMKLINFLEKQFEIEIELEDVGPENFSTIHSIYQYVERLKT